MTTTPDPILEREKNVINDYESTIFATIGFINLYRYDDQTGQMKSDVLVFHGRKFTPSTLPMAYVTPDLAISYGSNKGVIGEVKISFPLDESLWLEDLKQVMNYDDDLIGWPTPDEKCENYDIVLLTHISRSKQIKTFIEQHPEIKFKKPFIPDFPDGISFRV